MAATISVMLDQDQLARFAKVAGLRGVSPEEAPRNGFVAVVDEILAAHGEVPRRLAR